MRSQCCLGEEDEEPGRPWGILKDWHLATSQVMQMPHIGGQPGRFCHPHYPTHYVPTTFASLPLGHGTGRTS